MKLKAIVLSFIIFFSCSSKVEPKIIEIDRTHKIQSSQALETAEELVYLWTPPKGPKDSDSKWIINDDIMLFTPDKTGEYTVSLIVENLSGKILLEENFFFLVEGKNNYNINTVEKIDTTKTLSQNKIKTEPSIKKDEKKKKLASKQISTKKNYVKKGPYTIQVSAWPSLELAKKDQLLLTKRGIDAYTERVFLDKKNAYWWRVRVGNFSKLNQALIVKKQIEKIRGSSAWIDKIK